MELVKASKKTRAEWLTQTVRLERKWGNDRSFSKSDSLGQRLVEEAMKSHNTLLMAVDPIAASVVGYILFRRNGAEGHIDRIAVAEHRRRKGLARSLLQSAIAALRTNRAMTLVLEVDTTNDGAIALYGSQGFKRTTVRTDYYKSGCDALLMELRL